jgi:hypothetical protein
MIRPHLARPHNPAPGTPAGTADTAIGPSTGAVHHTDPGRGAAAARYAGCRALEVSALHENELPAVERLLTSGAVNDFQHVSVHAPLKGRTMPETELVARLDALGLPVVAHPPTLATPRLWRRLGGRLLVENDDARKPAGQTPADLARLFDQLPDAGHCLDVSHAVDAGGRALAISLAAAFGDRTGLCHIGCAGGRPVTGDLEPDLLGTLTAVLQQIGRPVPVIIERRTDHRALAPQVREIRCAAAAAFGI